MYCALRRSSSPYNVMHDSERGRNSGPKAQGVPSGPGRKVESKQPSAPNGRPHHDGTGAVHPVARVYGLLGNSSNSEEYLEEIRGR